jgi:release factor glutamine methyltransferase
MAEATILATVSEVLRDGARRLQQAGCDTPRLDAELLLADALGCRREQLVREAKALLDSDGRERYHQLLERRVRREPVAYILGRKEFRFLSVAVDQRALIPRPETELLVEVGRSLPRGARVLELGTGSGAVALALKHERSDLELWASDVSGDALALARENAQRLALDVQFVQGDLLDGLVAGAFDALLANLPYVAEGEPLAPEIACYEPRQALFAGPDGLALIQRLVHQLESIPLVALEVGAGQAPTVARLLSGGGFAAVELVQDLAGHERVVVARR